MSAQDTQSRLADMERLIGRINADYSARHKCNRPPARPPVAMAAYLCKRCGYGWKYYADKPKPRICPNCRSRLWETPRPTPAPRISETRRKCFKCGHEWGARKAARPCACPACHSRMWDSPSQTSAGKGQKKG